LCPRCIVNGVPLDGKQKNQEVLHGYAAQDQKRQNNDDIINKPGCKPKENSNLGIGTLITLSKLTDEMDPNYVLHALPSQREERSEKWAWPLIATEKKVDQNEALFNFLKHNSLILNERAVSGDGKDYMKLEPNLSTKTKDMEKEVDSRMKEVDGNKPFVGQKGKMAKKTAPPRKVDKVTPPSKAKWESCANFLLFLEKFKILTRWVMFDVHIHKFNGYQELFQFLVTAAQVLEVEKPDQRTPLGCLQFKCKVLVGTMRKCCEDADWREHAVKTCSLKIWDEITRHPDFVNQSNKTEEIEHMLSGSKCARYLP
jgi:hypothetical protein